MSSFKAFGDYVIIAPDKKEVKKVSSGMLELTEEQMGEDIRYREATIVSSPVDEIKDGGRIIYDSAAGYEVPIGEVVYRIIKLRDIAAYGTK